MGAVPPWGAADPAQLGKLRWRCRRGMKELDVLLTRYMDECFCNAPDPEQRAFRLLLEIPDPLLYAYCLGSQRPPLNFTAIIERITSKPCA